MKITVYALAVERRECYGHGDYGDLLRIEQQGAYGSGPAFFHPLFLSEEKANAYLDSLGDTIFEEFRVVTLELEASTDDFGLSVSEMAECEFVRNGGWLG
jgi:hypothetical protein